MKRYLLILFAALQCAAVAYAADEVTFTASAPRTVIAQKPFQLSYVVNAGGAKNLRAPEITGFEILAGPFESRSSSTQWINGKRSSSTTCTFTYTLMAAEAGTFTIPSATVTVGRDKYTSNGLIIEVLPPDQTPNQGQSSGRQSGSTSSPTADLDDNLFVRTLVSKRKVHEQECVLLTYKLYTLVDVAQFTNNTKIPDFEGFLKQEIKDDTQGQMAYEHYDGRNYGTVVLHQVLLYPQRTGAIKIDNARFEAVVRVQNRAQVRSIFDDFFNSYSNVNKMLIAPSVTIDVASLPAGRPDHFSGGVGQFSITSDITSTQVKAHEAVTLKVKIMGKGNMKLLKNPEIDFPEGFEIYSPKTTNNFKTTTSGVSGTKTIEYLFIPRVAGEYTVPSVEFSYFDPQAKQYKTLRTLPYTLQVEKGEGDSSTPVVGGNYVSQEDIKQLGKDIRYIYNGHIEPVKEQPIIIFTWVGWCIYLVPLFLAFLAFLFFRQQIRENADLARVKHKKANQIARRRLKVAQKHLKAGERDQFYDEVLRVMWVYLSDKLSIPVANLNKANVSDQLSQHQVADEHIEAFIDLLNTCEFARYAPGQADEQMQTIYIRVSEVISNLESGVKKR